MHESVGPRRAYLRAVGTQVAAGDLRDDHLLQAVLVEDACWALALDAWAARRPAPWRRRALRRWYAEHAELSADRRRIERLAGYCGSWRGNDHESH